jgi:hypothetical protein
MGFLFNESCLHCVCTVGSGNQIECKEGREISERKMEWKINSAIEMAALYFATSCEGLKIECKFRIFKKMFEMLWIDLGYIESQRNI